MRKIVQFMHVSLDGFVASTNRGLDWVTIGDEIFDFAANRTNESDTALYGRNTFDLMEGYWPTAADKPNPSKHDIEHSTWYKQVDKIVLSKSMKGKKIDKVKVISENVTSEILKLKQGNGKEIIIFGSPSASHSLMREKLIDELWLFVNPVLLGEGIPMFKDLKEKTKLKLIASHTFDCGVVCLHYETI